MNLNGKGYNPKLVMQFFEEPEHLRIIVNYPTGAKTFWLPKAATVQMMQFIFQQSSPLKPEEEKRIIHAR